MIIILRIILPRICNYSHTNKIRQIIIWKYNKYYRLEAYGNMKPSLKED